MENEHNAEYGRWEVCRVITADRVREDQERLNSKLAEGWEPFAATQGPGGHCWYLRRHTDA